MSLFSDFKPRRTEPARSVTVRLDGRLALTVEELQRRLAAVCGQSDPVSVSDVVRYAVEYLGREMSAAESEASDGTKV